LKESVLHGKRPYVMGCCILETHRVMPSGVYQLGKGLQDEANEVVNQRLDNVKFALNKKWFAKRGRDVDIGGLIRNVPGGVVMMDDPEKDVREISWPDVTQSAYEEQNRINLDMDELLGNFNPAGLMSSGAHQNSPARNMSMLNQASGTMVEYMIRTYVETFIQPVLRQLILLEQYYETDEVVLALVSKNAASFQRFGMDQVTDDLLKSELTLTVNVGMGATDPSTKLNKFLSAMSSFSQMAKSPPPGVNLQEVGKEIFGHLGYSDGSRFFTNDNPQVLAMQKQLQDMSKMLQETQQKLNDKTMQNTVGLQKVQVTSDTKERIAANKEENANKRTAVTHIGALLMAQHNHHSQAVLKRMDNVATKPE
jgi:DNA-binding protein YbaB